MRGDSNHKIFSLNLPTYGHSLCPITYRERECMAEWLISQPVSFKNLLRQFDFVASNEMDIDELLIKIVCLSTTFRCLYLHVRRYPFSKWSFSSMKRNEGNHHETFYDIQVGILWIFQKDLSTIVLHCYFPERNKTRSSYLNAEWQSCQIQMDIVSVCKWRL